MIRIATSLELALHYLSLFGVRHIRVFGEWRGCVSSIPKPCVTVTTPPVCVHNVPQPPQASPAFNISSFPSLHSVDTEDIFHFPSSLLLPPSSSLTSFVNLKITGNLINLTTSIGKPPWPTTTRRPTWPTSTKGEYHAILKRTRKLTADLNIVLTSLS